MKREIIIIGLLLLILGLIGGTVFTLRFDIFSPAHSQPDRQKMQVEAPAEALGIEDAVINVANTTGKAVVSISAQRTEKIGGARRYYFSQPFGGSPFGGEDPFKKFFEDFFGEMPDREYKQMGLGSGVIIDAQGYILTNEHVISNADKISVTLPDGREFKGTVKGRDVRSDLAVIKIEAKDLPVALLGDSDSVKIGQWVVAIGNPFGFALQNPEPTVTAGVISALHRSLGEIIARERDYNDLIQTDAAINPGNSGGPLVNLKGEVVGINVAIFSTSGGYQGVGFAIPVNSAKRIISRLIEGKKIAYGWMGVTVQNLSDDLAQYMGLTDKSGVLISDVINESPAQKAGLKEGDIIKQLSGKQISNVKELLSEVAKSEVGRKIKVAVRRDKKELTLDLQVGERPQELGGVEQEESFSEAANWRGLEVESLTAENSSRFRVEEKEGVVIKNIETASPADEAGLMPGEVILEINKQPVKNTADYEKLTKGLKSDALVRTNRGYFVLKGGK